MFISNGILFNHESPRRGTNFVTNKVVKAAVEIKKGLLDALPMGNLQATRDWGHAKDYVEAMWRMLQLDAPKDLVIASGEQHSVREFVEVAAKHCTHVLCLLLSRSCSCLVLWVAVSRYAAWLPVSRYAALASI